MNLTVEWQKATRSEHEVRKIEQAYRDRLIGLFGSVEKAYQAKEQWNLKNNPPIDRWTTFNRIAHIEATSDLLPTERRMAAFILKFEDDPK